MSFDPKDPVIAKIVAASYEAHDSAMALGQRMLELQAEVNALRGEIFALTQKHQPSALPPPQRDFRPSHYSQFDSSDPEVVRQAIKRWLEGR